MTNTLSRSTTAALAALVLGMGAAGQPARAQTTPAPTSQAAPVSEMPLPIPTPPQDKVAVEMNLHEADLLGVLKSILRGAAQGLSRASAAANAASGTAAPAMPSEADLSAVVSDALKTITHVHVAVLQVPGAISDAAAKAPGAAGKALSAMPDLTAFYETAFSAQGGHRIVYSNTDKGRFLLMGFGPGEGFAAVAQGPTGTAVVRADGYPDFTKLAALATQLGAMSHLAPQNASASK